MDFRTYLDLQKHRVSQVVDTSLQQFKSEDWQVVTMMGQQKYVSLFDRHWDIVCDYPSRRGKYLLSMNVCIVCSVRISVC